MPTYSHSRLSCFEQCPRKYFYQYIAKIKIEEEEGIEGFLGTLVHDALEKLYRDRINGKLLSVDELVDSFKTEWAKRYHDGIVIVRTEYTAEDYRNVGEECLRKYYARHAPFDQSTTIALEERVTFKLDDAGKYGLVGFIDRLSQAPDGRYEIHDYKTNARLPSQEDKDGDRQLALYQIGIQNRWEDVDQVDLVWHFLRHDKEIRSSRTKADLDALRKDTICLIDDIESRHEEHEFQTCESALCDWCVFQPMCPVRKHLFATDSLPPNRFLEEPGVKLVNRYADTTTKIKALKGEIRVLENECAEVEEALFAHAEKEKLEVIVGSDHNVKIVHHTQAAFPRKTYEPEAYQELESQLRHSKVWLDVSAMDVSKLRAIWLGSEPDPGQLAKMLQPFVKTEQVRKLRLRKRDSEE